MVAKGKFTKPSEGDLKALCRVMSEKAAEAARVKDRELKSPPNMMQAIADSYYLFQWVSCISDNVLVDQIKEYYEMIPHFANKVIMKKRQESDQDVEWMRAHLELCGAFKDFCIENAGSMWHWNGKGQSGGIDEWIDGASANLGDFSFVPSICGGGSAGSAPASKPAGARPAGKDLGAALTAELADKLAALKAASAALGVAQVSKATDQFISMIGFNTAMLTAMAKFKKPVDTLFLKDPYGALAEDMNKVKDRDMKAPVNHMKGLCDSIPIFFWFSATSGEEAKDYLVEFHGQIFFWTNKILKEGKALDDAWTNAFTACATALKDFVVERRDTILNWNGSEDGAGAKAFYEAACKSAGGASPAPTTAPAVEEKKTAPTPAPVKAAAGAPVKKVKAPIKELVRNRWAIENQGKEHLKFEGEDQVNRKIAFQIFDCKETTIEIVGKA
jgi:hypothetical protein